MLSDLNESRHLSDPFLCIIVKCSCIPVDQSLVQKVYGIQDG